MKDTALDWSLQMFAEGGEGAAAPAGGEGTAEAPAEKATFDDLLKDADYKKEFDKRVKSSSGYATRKAMAEERAKYAPMFEALGRKYGMDVTDPAKIDMERLSQSVLNDSDMLEEEAAKEGLTVDALRKVRGAEQQLRAAESIRRAAEQQREWQEIMGEAQQLKELYPAFDMDAEMQNESFAKLLASLRSSGFPDAVRTAYESAHRDEIMGGAMQYAVQRTKQQVSNSIQSGAKRPSENGAGAAAQTKFDPAAMSGAQIEDVRRRVMRGERITFNT